MADLIALRQQIADAIAPVMPDVNVWPDVPDQIQTPCVVIEPDFVDWASGAFARGAEPWTFLARVLVGTVYNQAAREMRDSFLGGTRDVKDAVEAQVPSCFVSSARKFDAWTVAEIDYLGVEIVIEVTA
jgi:hypothetical protein